MFFQKLNFKNDPFTVRITVAVLLANLFLFSILLYSVDQNQKQSVEKEELLLNNIARILESDLSGNIETLDTALTAVKEEYERQLNEGHINRSLLSAYMQRMVSRLPELDAIRITDQNGIIRYGSDISKDTGIDLSDRQHFRSLKEDPRAQLAFSKPQISRANDKWVIVFAKRMEGKDGSLKE
jgi:two-component system, cell cycle sensor histidine kinase and response regulator CckA